MAVVDASVAVKWFISEEHAPEALDFFDSGVTLEAPSLAKYEVMSALCRRTREGHITTEQLAVHRWHWLQMIARNTIRLTEDNRDIERGSDLSIQLDHQLQDCIYLAMAERLAAPLVTADDKLIAKAREYGYDVRHILEMLNRANQP